MSGRAARPLAPVSGPRLLADLRRLGVRAGGVLLVHARMSALGWVVGGSEVVVRALLTALGPEGTLVVYTSWEEHRYRLAERPREHRAAYERHPPVFAPATSEAARDHGRLPERVRTWPGAQRSPHPEASVAAVGARARRIAHPHPDDDGYGAESPFARVVAADAQILLLGAPLETLTLLHHAEAIARVEPKRRITYRVRVARSDGAAEDRDYTDIETSLGAFAYGKLGLDEDPFTVIAREALATGIGVRGPVGHGESHLFPAPALTAFAVAWMEERFA